MKYDICWVYSSPFSKIGCFEKWKRFYSKERAKAFIEKKKKQRNFLFIRYILVNNMEVDNL